MKVLEIALLKNSPFLLQASKLGGKLLNIKLQFFVGPDLMIHPKMLAINVVVVVVVDVDVVVVVVVVTAMLVVAIAVVVDINNLV